ncbi:MAG TPA: lytic transglycosylase domain-containing protein [Burkholderiaceae bacterium]|nr:lytic transglycosylase domain-containing protein [Burkholderiaceae bacterium]
MKSQENTSRSPKRVLPRKAAIARALTLALYCLWPPANAWAATHYQCTAIDGSSYIFEDDPSQRFQWMLAGCRTVRRPDDPPRLSPYRQQAPAEPTEIVLIARQAPPVKAADNAGGIAQPIGIAPPMSAPPRDLLHMIRDAAKRYGVDARVVHAVMQVESAFDARARSPKGAVGLMQLMPATAARLGMSPNSNLFDPALNIDLGVRYLRLLGDMFGDRLDLMLAAYNAGEGAVVKYGMQVPPYPETQAYVRKILSLVNRR